MDCEHADTTMLWLYGEADDGHEAHVAACPVCQALVAEHTDVAAALGPCLGAVQRTGAPPQRDIAPRRRSYRVAVAALALAAAALVWVVASLGGGAAPDPEPRVVRADAPVDDGVLAALEASRDRLDRADAFDLELDDLDWELDELSRELELL